MQLATGTVVDGKVVVEGVPLVEGSVVAVISRGAEEGFCRSGQHEDEPLEAIAEVNRGEYVAGAERCGVVGRESTRGAGCRRS